MRTTAAMLICGGGFSFAEPPVSDRRPAGPIFVSVRRLMQATKINPKKPARRNGSLQNASKCFEML
jgi:hypothetical protein